MWMRSSRAVRASDYQCQSAIVATVLDSNPASSDTVESEGVVEEAVLKNVLKMPPLNKVESNTFLGP
jgi:hypothetical protein